MRYWGFLAAKLAAVAGLMTLAWIGFHAVWPEPEPFMRVQLSPFARDLGYTVAVMVLGLVGAGLVYLVLLDQHFRCRTCLRRLRMPLTGGAWNRFLLEPPRTEYICPYGHGTLRVPDVHIGDEAPSHWKPIDDMWKELSGVEESRK